MKCPVCHHADVHPLALRCPQCAVPLSAVRLLDGMAEHYIEREKERLEQTGQVAQKRRALERQLRTSRRWRNAWLFLFLLATGICWWFWNRPAGLPENTVANLRDSVQIWRHQAEQRDVVIDAIQRELASIRATGVQREVRYVVREGDYLFQLGELFYGDTTSWRQIAADNNIQHVRQLPVGDTLTIRYRKLVD